MVRVVEVLAVQAAHGQREREAHKVQAAEDEVADGRAEEPHCEGWTMVSRAQLSPGGEGDRAVVRTGYEGEEKIEVQRQSVHARGRQRWTFYYRPRSNFILSLFSARDVRSVLAANALARRPGPNRLTGSRLPRFS